MDHRGLILVALLVACGGKEDDGPSAPAAPEPASTPAPAAKPEPKPAPPPAPAAIVITSSAEAHARIDQPVRITGTAKNAKLAGVVVTGDLTVYCLDRKSGWGALSNTQVTVEGVLIRTDRFAAKPRPDGAQVAGTGGAILAIEQCAVAE